MTFLQKLTGSTVGKKILMSLSGMVLSAFLVGHLVGNLQLLLPDHGEAFNRYAHFLVNLGELLVVAELGLIAALAIHMYFAIQTWSISKNARGAGYAMETTKGGDSKSNLASRNMLLFGVLIFVFIVIHLLQFKWGLFDNNPRHTVYPDAPQKVMRDLYFLVVTSFQNIGWVLAYTFFLVALGFHLRHGLWSMFQSIGALPRAQSAALYTAAFFAALAMAVGFIALPWIIYLVPHFDGVAAQHALTPPHAGPPQ